MPRFCFHVHDDIHAEDAEGADFPDSAAAREHAVEEARILVCESVKRGHLNLDHYIEIEDEQGNRTPVTFREAFTVEG